MISPSQISKPIQFGISTDVDGFGKNENRRISDYLHSQFKTLPDSVQFTVRPGTEEKDLRIAITKQDVSVVYASSEGLLDYTLNEPIKETITELGKELHQACLDLDFWSRTDGKD